MFHSSEQAVQVSSQISHLFVKSLRPFIEGNFVRTVCVTKALLHKLQEKV